MHPRLLAELGCTIAPHPLRPGTVEAVLDRGPLRALVGDSAEVQAELRRELRRRRRAHRKARA